MTARPEREPSGGRDDALLVAARRDPDAFGSFYDLRYQLVASFFYRRTLCAHTTADLTAETFARTWITRARFDPRKGSATAWTMGIAANLHRRWSSTGSVSTAARARLSIQTPDLVVEDLERIEHLIDLAELRQELRVALDGLSGRVKDAVVLRVALDLPYEDVADRLGCSVGAARVRVSRGLDALATALEGSR